MCEFAVNSHKGPSLPLPSATHKITRTFRLTAPLAFAIHVSSFIHSYQTSIHVHNVHAGSFLHYNQTSTSMHKQVPNSLSEVQEVYQMLGDYKSKHYHVSRGSRVRVLHMRVCMCCRVVENKHTHTQWHHFCFTRFTLSALLLHFAGNTSGVRFTCAYLAKQSLALPGSPLSCLFTTDTT